MTLVAAAAACGSPVVALAGVGALDQTFGTGGSVLSRFAPTVDPVSAGGGVASASNGGVYQSGTATDGSSKQELFLARFLANGSLDTSFGTSGVAMNAAAGNPGGEIIVLPSGDVIVCGTDSLAEFTSTGVLDTSFAAGSSTPGVYFADPKLPNEQTFSVAGIARQSDGKLVLTANVQTGPSSASITGSTAIVERLNANGTLDSGFASGGTYTVPPGTALFPQVQVTGPIVDSAGNIVFPVQPSGVGGGSVTGTMTLDSLSTAGAVNPGFPASLQTSGYMAGPQSIAFSVMQASNGDYIAAGFAYGPDANADLSAAAFRPTGAPDTAFGGGGTGGVDFGTEGLVALSPTAIFQQPDGRFVLTSTYENIAGSGPEVGRLLANGTPDPSFGVEGAVALNLANQVTLTGAALSSDGQLLLSGSASTPSGIDAYLGKLTLDTPPSLAFTVLPAAPVAGQPVTFTATTSDATSTPSVSWDLGSGAFGEATGLTATMTFPTAGTYTIRAQSTDGDGLSTTQQQTVTVGPAPPPLTTTTTTTTTTTGTLPAPLPASECTSSLQPTTTLGSKLLLTAGLELAGTSAAHCPSTIASVGIAIARVQWKKCSFLVKPHHWGKYGSCTPTAYLSASGTYSWTFALKQRFTAGRYWVWEHATDDAGVANVVTAATHVAFTLKGARR